MKGLLLLLAVAGCDSGYCGPDSDIAAEDGAPHIKDMSMIDDAVPGDPWELIFTADFTDDDGNLGRGQAHVYLNSGNEPTNLDLFDAFRQSGLSEAVRRGTLALPLRFADTVPDGADVKVGLMLEDARHQRSNCYGLDLNFEVRE